MKVGLFLIPAKMVELFHIIKRHLFLTEISNQCLVVLIIELYTNNWGCGQILGPGMTGRDKNVIY